MNYHRSKDIKTVFYRTNVIESKMRYSKKLSDGHMSEVFE